MRRLLRHHGRTGLRLTRQRRQLAGHRPRFAGGLVGRGADAGMTAHVRVVIPAPLRQLARVTGELQIEAAPGSDGRVTQRTLLDAVEARYPMLRGTMRDHDTKKRRAYVRFYACEEDLSLETPDAPLPDAVADGREPFLVVGALAGG